MRSESQMNKQTVANSTPTGVFYRYPWLKQGISVMGGLGVLSSGLVVAQTDAPIDTGAAPAAPPAPPAIKFTPPPPAPPAQPKPAAPQVIVAPPAPAPAPKPAYRPPAPPAPKPADPAPVTVSKPPAPAPAAPTPPAATPPAAKPRLNAPNLSIPAPATLAKPPKVIVNPSPAQTATQTPAAPNNSYIDPTNYSLGATRGAEKPTVVVTERSTGCQTVSRNGRLTSGSCGGQGTPTSQTVAGRIQPQTPQPQGGTGGAGTRLPTPPVATPPVAVNASVRRPLRSVQRVAVSGNSGGRQFTRRPPVSSLSPTASPKTTSTGLTYYNFSNRPQGRPIVGNASFIFPLTIPSAISSVFGWRTHPITGTFRFHSGTDIAAPTGTPVLAVAPGEVATADYLGGYGLTVILRHEEGTQESRYAHLSEVFVQPGESVDQGNVIGLVGSTGFSTGPHLHFEWRHQTTDGWVAVDAGAHLEYAMAQLIEALQVAQAIEQPDS